MHHGPSSCENAMTWPQVRDGMWQYWMLASYISHPNSEADAPMTGISRCKEVWTPACLLLPWFGRSSGFLEFWNVYKDMSSYVLLKIKNANSFTIFPPNYKSNVFRFAQEPIYCLLFWLKTKLTRFPIYIVLFSLKNVLRGLGECELTTSELSSRSWSKSSAWGDVSSSGAVWISHNFLFADVSGEGEDGPWVPGELL